MNFSTDVFYKPGKSRDYIFGKDGHPIGQALSVLINVVSVFLVALSLLDHLSSLYLWIGLSTFVLSLGGILYFKAFPLMVYASRVLVGGLFIVSGLIKANDPEGFAYKLHDYFAENALNLEFLNDYAIYFSILVAVGEIVLGIATVIGGKMRLTSWTLLILILFFSWLTFYTSSCLETRDTYNGVVGNVASGDRALESDKTKNALVLYQYAESRLDDLGSTYQDSLRPAIEARLDYLNSGKHQNDNNVDSTLESMATVPFWRECVDDCGCFGDALKGSVGRSLYPWESFGKDAVLLYFVLMIFIFQGRISLNNRVEDIFLMGGSLSVIIFLGFVLGNWFFPLLFSIVLFGLTIAIKRYLKRFDKEWAIAILVTVITLGFAIYTYTYLPIKDYRPYAVGNNLKEQMNNGVVGKSVPVLRYLNVETKEERDVTEEELNQIYKELAEDYVMLSREDKVIIEGRLASIVDFGPTKYYSEMTEMEKNDPMIQKELNNDQLYPLYKIFYLEEYEQYDTVDAESYDPEYYPDSVYSFVKDYRQEPQASDMIPFKDYLFEQKRLIFVISKKLDGLNESAVEDLVTLIKDAEKDGTPVYILTSSGEDDVEAFKHKHDIGKVFLIQDETELKIVVRSNPGVLYLENAEIKGKWSSWNIPDYKSLGD